MSKFLSKTIAVAKCNKIYCSIVWSRVHLQTIEYSYSIVLYRIVFLSCVRGIVQILLCFCTCIIIYINSSTGNFLSVPRASFSKRNHLDFSLAYFVQGRRCYSAMTGNILHYGLRLHDCERNQFFSLKKYFADRYCIHRRA